MKSFKLASLIKNAHLLFLLSECQKSQVMYHLAYSILQLVLSHQGLLEQVTNLAHSPQQLNHFFSGISRQRIPNEKIDNVILKVFNKYQGDFSNVCQSKQELLDFYS